MMVSNKRSEFQGFEVWHGVEESHIGKAVP